MSSSSKFDCQLDLRAMKRDRSITVTLLVLLLILGAVLLFFMLILQMVGTACGGVEEQCNYSMLGIAAMITPVVVLVFTVGTIVALVRQEKTMRHIKQIPAFGILSTIVSFLISSFLVYRSVQGALR